ncbi:MAG: nucleotidyltransferase domain-containing protein [Cyanobacteria bacterium]|nr:nucleotidyltransferase domain-containing protein [Cyanobacteriota bacterium]
MEMHVAGVARESAGLRLLILHGSRARGQFRPDSDWDFAYIADATFDPDLLLARLSETLGDKIDLADLDRASALLRFKAAAEGRALFESERGIFDRFRLTAIQTWCDMQPVLSRAYGAALARAAQ